MTCVNHHFKYATCQYYLKLGFRVKFSFFHPTIITTCLDSSLDFESLNLHRLWSFWSFQFNFIFFRCSIFHVSYFKLVRELWLVRCIENPLCMSIEIIMYFLSWKIHCLPWKDCCSFFFPKKNKINLKFSKFGQDTLVGYFEERIVIFFLKKVEFWRLDSCLLN